MFQANRPPVTPPEPKQPLPLNLQELLAGIQPANHRTKFLRLLLEKGKQYKQQNQNP